MSEYTHMRLERDWDGLAWLWLDKAGVRANTLSTEVLEELADVLDALEKEPPTGLIIRSAKEAGFVAGADIDEFGALDVPDGKALIERGWTLFERLAALPFATLALIRGHCMGGGLELALACRYRVVVDEPATRLALPEVMLGIVPAWGGMKRLPRTVGPSAALDMMLTGRSIDADRARRMGLADACVPPRVMDNAARQVVLSGKHRRRPPLLQRLMNLQPLRPLVAAQAEKRLASRVRRAHYPAPYAILHIWSRHDGNALAVPAESEASLEHILGSETTRNLVRVFHLRERLKRFGRVEEGGASFKARHVHVVGAGVMGGDIATLCAEQGLTVSLQDQDIERVAQALGRARKHFERRLRGDRRRVMLAMDRMLPDPAGHGVSRADVIIEAIVEDLGVKRGVFAEIERAARGDAVLATNTSSLKLEDIAAGLERPERLVGIHFFNPVAKMPLVEVIDAADSDGAVHAQALQFVRQLDKLPLPVRSAPGFLVNAVLTPYLFEALRCVEEGVAPEAIDRALVDFGMPVGPVELVDLVGLDIAQAAGRAINDGDVQPPACLTERIERGDLGKKRGQGFYRWENGKAVKQKPEEGAQEGLAERIIEPLLMATEVCVKEQIVADDELADAGVIFGTGFAPFTGGPMNYAARQHEKGAPTASENTNEAERT
jgi:3-hydroxyacyl-CoA dehydrogenase / enoyl-CoA hydratase / 3-hydroxybutyryl-CoA epimerase